MNVNVEPVRKNQSCPSYNMLPIVSNEGIDGSIIVFSNDKGYDFCKLLNKIITLELNIS